MSNLGELFGIAVSTTSFLKAEPVPDHAYAVLMDDVRRAIAEMGVVLN